MKRHIVVWLALAASSGCNGRVSVESADDEPVAASDLLRRCNRGGRHCDAGTVPAPLDSGIDSGIDSGPLDSGPRDSGPLDSGPLDSGPPATACVPARRLWFEDFETGDYSRWSGGSYGDSWGTSCQSNGFSTAQVRSGRMSHRSEISCRSHTDVHRGYGGVQFSGDRPLSGYTNTGVGIEAPYGVVNTFWVNLDVPYDFGGGRWLSLFTVESDCGWAERVVTLGLENSSRRLTPAHILDTGGTVTWASGAPSLPLRRWARVTVYVNYHRGEMHVWQDGASVVHATFRRPTTDMCQFHWGAYASGDNDSLVLFEDDNSIWRLEQAWTDFSREPWFEGGVTPCP